MNKKDSKNLFQAERQEQIINILENKNRVIITELCEKFKTTPVTIRSDLSILEKEGLLKRTHGGAIKNKSLYPGLALPEKEKLHLDEKMKIAKEAAKLILKGDTIILDSGSTTTLLAKEIKNYTDITVITNAINIAFELSQSKFEVILTGGSLQKESSTLIGPFADEVLQRISADKLFQGVDGIDFEVGLTTPNIIEAKTSRTMMSVSCENILLVDSSKFGRRSLGIIAKVKEVNHIITTKKFTKNEAKRFSDIGVEVTIV